MFGRLLRNRQTAEIYQFHYETNSKVDVYLDYLEMRFPFIVSFIIYGIEFLMALNEIELRHKIAALQAKQ